MVATPINFSIFEIMNKTKQINVRLTEAEFVDLKNNAVNYKNLSAYILDACSNFDDRSTIKRIDFLNSWAEEFKKYKSDLSHLGVNINQLTHYINTQINMGIYTSTAIQSEVSLLESINTLLSQLHSQNGFLINEFRNILKHKR